MMMTSKTVAGRGSVGKPTYPSAKKTMVFSIHDFESLEPQKYETTPVACHGYQWQLQVYPWGKHNQKEEAKSVAIYLQKASPDTPVKAQFAIKLSGKKNFEEVSERRMFNKGHVSWGWRKIKDRFEIIENHLDTCGTLNVEVELQCWLETKATWKPENLFQRKVHSLYNTMGATADVTFSLGSDNTIVQAHTCVLCIQCKMLYEIVCDTADDEAPIEIESASADLFSTMVRFMYYATLPDIFDLGRYGMDLLKLADRFGYSELKLHLEADIVDAGLVVVENAAEYLVLADAHCCALLREEALDVIIVNASDVVTSKGWTQLSASSALVAEIFKLQSEGGINADDENVSTLRKRLYEAEMDFDGTKEMLVKRLKRE